MIYFTIILSSDKEMNSFFNDRINIGLYWFWSSECLSFGGKEGAAGGTCSGRGCTSLAGAVLPRAGTAKPTTAGLFLPLGQGCSEQPQRSYSMV